MSSRQLDYWLSLEEEELSTSHHDDSLRTHRRAVPRLKSIPEQAAERAQLVESEEPSETFQFTYQPTRHERLWLTAALHDFYEDHIITDVLHRVLGGKEATVYCCQANPSLRMDLVAAKVYRPRIFRSLKNDALYKQGRELLGADGKPMRDQRAQRAVQKKTRTGAAMEITSWIEHEYQTLQSLARAGIHVPRPVARSENTILMEFIGEVHNPAPALSSVTLSTSEAPLLFATVLGDIRRMLAHDRVHADLSAYNILYWEGNITLIDFPQVIDPLYNPRGFELLLRDVERVCQYFSKYGLRTQPQRLAAELWDRYLRHDLS